MKTQRTGSLYALLCVCVWQVWGMVLLNQETRLLTGSADSELRAWDISYLQEVRRDAQGTPAAGDEWLSGINALLVVASDASRGRAKGEEGQIAARR